MLNQEFYGHGKLLLTGEYFVLDGAKALALPTTVGQKMSVKCKKSFNPSLKWVSYDPTGLKWFDSEFEFWKFDQKAGEVTERSKILQKILLQARIQNPHFLRDDLDVTVETKLEFPVDWGLGSSSSLLYNIAQWAYVSPFELQSKTLGGSGYDIACAQSRGPINYILEDGTPSWKEVSFNPDFIENLYFIYLGQKQSTLEGIELYKQRGNPSDAVISRISEITSLMNEINDWNQFIDLLVEHETIVSEHLKIERIKDRLFSDFWGEVKSLGAWGGDFALVASDRPFSETRDYFVSKGFETFIPYHEIIRKEDQVLQ